MQAANADQAEIDKFDADAHQWWDPDGPYAPLHAINPLRCQYVRERAGGLAGKTVLDVGCGGGLLTEAMAAEQAKVSGIDLAVDSLAVARAHAEGGQLTIDYQAISAEALAETNAGQWDGVTCMEMLEHVPDPASVVDACARLVRPGGSVFFSTINRNTRAWLLAVIAAERVLQLLPRGTHDASAFIRPAELGRWCRAGGLRVVDLTGIQYNPLTGAHALTADTRVNYLCHAIKGHRE
jgi:2-polyprenyl-6-hydroxyphenyl methylase/3-demethylubiquinone-9 3-methyltransferase